MNCEVSFSKTINPDNNVDYTFLFKYGTTTSTMYFNTYGINKNQWRELLFAIRKNKNYELHILTGNDEITIETTDGMTSFTVGTSGGSNTGEMKTVVENKNCLSSFENLVASIDDTY